LREFIKALLAGAFIIEKGKNMSKGYIIRHLKIINSDAFKSEYASRIAPMLEAFGGRFLVRGGTVSHAEGEKADIDVVAEFSDVAAAQAFLSSGSYKEIEPGRTENTTGQFMIIEGV
jgi:uncharacterized protein (DUF1330 family)